MATLQPSNNSELQLYRVLQRANLLQYFETFITQGGDDVQQLCEAGEDEFLEIMALVGMASKPLHVRRLQKALQEWVANPAAFEVSKKYPTHVMSLTAASGQSISPSHSLERSNSLQDYKVTPSQSSTISTSTPWGSQARDASPSDGSNLDDPSSSNSPPGDFKDIMKDVLYNQNEPSCSVIMGMTQPVLLEHQITAIANAAALLARDLPPFEPKSLPKKQISKEIMKVMLLPADEPGRMNALRKYGAIYGRFDSKRKNHRPMSLHEISVNEAAAQLCSHFPALLTRREELFPLARQVVRDSGYQYSKGHSRYDEQGAAELLVQPKLEQGETVPSTSSLVPSPNNEESFSDLQAELTQITLELSELAKEQDRIRCALRVLLEMNDHEQMKMLTAEMDDLNDRQAAMTKRRQRIIIAISRFRKGNSAVSVPTGCTPKHSPKQSPVHGMSSGKSGNSGSKFSSTCYSYNDESQPTNPLNTLYMAALQNHKDSLFEEGLRIATQYGMSDFAQEIIGMKSTKEEVENTKESGVNVSSGSNSAFTSYSSPSSFSTSSGEAVTSSSSYAVAGGGKVLQMLPTSVLASGSDVELMHASIAAGHSSSINQKSLPVKSKTYHMHGGKNLPTGISSPDVSHLSSDESLDGVHADNIYPHSKLSMAGDKQSISNIDDSTAQGSTTTTTTITTKSGQIIEVETRRSSRRKNGEPDYYVINGGEKRFRNGNIRRSNSTSSERARRLSSSSSASSVTLAAPARASPIKIQKFASQADDEVAEQHHRIRPEAGKLTLSTSHPAAGADIIDSIERDGVCPNQVYTNDESDILGVRKKGRPLI